MEPTRTGVCQLDFVPLKYSCDADAFPFDWHFGIKAEVDMTSSHDDTSSILLWFGIDRVLVYSNKTDQLYNADNQPFLQKKS